MSVSNAGVMSHNGGSRYALGLVPAKASPNSSFSSTSNQRLTVVLRKPFGVGFHVSPGGDDPIVVDVKGVTAKAAGIKVGHPHHAVFFFMLCAYCCTLGPFRGHVTAVGRAWSNPERSNPTVTLFASPASSWWSSMVPRAAPTKLGLREL